MMNMNSVWNFVVAEWWKVVLPLCVLIGCVAAGFIIRKALFAWVRRWSDRTGHHLDAVFIPVLRTPIIIWFLILGLDLATRSSALPRRYVAPFNLSLEMLWIVSLTIIAAQLAGSLVRMYSRRASGVEKTTTLSKTLTQIVVFLMGLVVLLNHLHVDIRPLLTALGVGGLAVALALQDTLANLFAGFYISVSSQIRLGDYVKLNTGEEGYVTDITWRSTTLRALSNNYIFIPNSKLAQAIVTNYNLPTKPLGMNVVVRVGFDADTDRIEKMLVEEALEEKIAGLVTDPPPNVSWNPGVGDSAIQLSLNFQVEEFVNQYGVQSELRKRIFRRFRKEGIALPYPVEVIVAAPTSGGLPSAQ
jgi:small-conductance mechanosensitive channel